MEALAMPLVSEWRRPKLDELTIGRKVQVLVPRTDAALNGPIPSSSQIIPSGKPAVSRRELFRWIEAEVVDKDGSLRLPSGSIIERPSVNFLRLRRT
jgi:hypothetical protein